MIKYLGSKRRLLSRIEETFSKIGGVRSVIDLFSGTSRVGHRLKGAGYQVFANDHNAYASTLARCYVEADRERWLEPATRLIEELDAIPGRPGYFTETFCQESRFFQPRNGERVDSIRDEIARKGLDPQLEAIVVTSLMEAADRVDSTTGVQMAYLKSWAPRAGNRLKMRVPDLLPRARAGAGRAFELDALEAAQTIEADAVYIDPPYNQHKYLGNYHIWETLVRWDEPEAYGTAMKRIDCRTRSSDFNSKPRIHAAMGAILTALETPNLVVSFSNEGYISREEMVEILATKGEVVVLEMDQKRYVGAQIGIHSPAGEKVGSVSHLRNKEFLFIVTPEPLDLGVFDHLDSRG